MNTLFKPIDIGRVEEARNTNNARLLTDAQFEELVSICAILNREIRRKGSFIEKLGIFAFVVSLTERGISCNRAESLLREIFKSLYGKTPDQLRQELIMAEGALDDESIAMGVPYAFEILKMIENGDPSADDKMPMAFHRAFAHQASVMAAQLSITDATAKRIITEQFEKREGRSFYDEGKKAEEQYFCLLYTSPSPRDA